MQSTTLTHAKLRLSESNVRKANGDAGLEALAASIAEHGLLQPLIVSPSAGKKTLYDVHAGGRRWRAIGLLIERGVLPRITRSMCASARTRTPPRARSALRKT
jgi:ParB family chromosome partitioning protein